MMGQQGAGQDRLFYSFNLDDHVPQDHLLRGVDRFLDLGELRKHLAPFYSHTGRPSIDPELTIRMLLVGYCFGIRSERRLCEEVPPEPGLPVVLPPGTGRQGARSLQLLEEPAWSFPRERRVPSFIRGCVATLHGRRPGARRRFRNDLQSASTAVAGRFNVRTNTSAQIRARASGASTNLWIGIFGWIDRRGRDL